MSDPIPETKPAVTLLHMWEVVSEICSLLYVFQGHSGKRSGHLHPERERKKRKGRKGRRSHPSNALPSHFPNCSLSQSKMRSIAACLHMSGQRPGMIRERDLTPESWLRWHALQPNGFDSTLPKIRAIKKVTKKPNTTEIRSRNYRCFEHKKRQDSNIFSGKIYISIIFTIKTYLENTKRLFVVHKKPKESKSFPFALF